MHQLTGLDGAFLAMETSAVFGHVGSVCIVDPSTSAVPLNLAQLTEMVGSRLPLVPPFRRRLAEVPFGLDQPYWIEDPDFDLEYHVARSPCLLPGPTQCSPSRPPGCTPGRWTGLVRCGRCT